MIPILDLIAIVVIGLVSAIFLAYLVSLFAPGKTPKEYLVEDLSEISLFPRCTSCNRIFAGNPQNECETCQKITKDVKEILETV